MPGSEEAERPRILVADDEMHLRNILKINLEIENFNVITAQDGEEALAKAVSENPDLVILDVSMPKMDGYTVCKKIRSQGFTMPVIMLTARTQVHDRVEGLECGADDYVCKPFDMEELLARLGAQLRRVETTKDQIKHIIDNKWDEINEGFRLFEENQPRVASFDASHFNVGFQFIPSGKIGGDFCQLIEKDQNRIMVILGDTVGKGLKAALLMASTFGILDTLAREHDSPMTIVSEANRIMLESLRSVQKGFVTVFVGVIDKEKREFTYCNAGSFPPIIIHRNTRKHELLKTTGVFIGMYTEPEYTENVAKYEEGDRLILYTDGLIEAKNKAGKNFGIKRLYRLLLKNMECPVKDLSTLLMHKVEAFLGGNFFLLDDLTFLVLEFL
ncbi:MAG: SpoIIE family protein phosphatase [Candidatus Eremiobacteraeota bacterium]|nr:SpoIIE family protein phosphatase [Candidatus Eremiobacteraeota bacterium]